MQTTLISWFTSFVLMRIVTFNLNVLPVIIPVYAIPLSLLEAFIGSVICIRFSPNNR